jgi:hypothetical protein
MQSSFDTYLWAVYAEALQEIRVSCTHINEFVGLLACELAKSPGGTENIESNPH